ncbi:hypothetical protein FORC82_p498 (plasmid) [Escherichia coli]|nr:hypothetical protein PPECC33_p3101 [Escherichia coli PCN033]QAZ75019.1 hypothetical protein FORC82_p498 [Escherichia coli]
MITAVWKCRGVSTNHNHCEINITGHFIMNKGDAANLLI